MARAKRRSDEVYNVRRRLTRQANRYLKKAEKATGAEKLRFEQMARRAMSDVAATYQGNKFGSKLQKLIDKSGFDVKKPAKVDMQAISKRAERGKFRITRQSRRDQMAANVFASNAGSRIIAAFEPVWREKARVYNPDTGYYKIDQGKILEAIREHLGVSDNMGIIEASEKTLGESLYKSPEDQIKYDEIVLQLRSAFRMM